MKAFSRDPSGASGGAGRRGHPAVLNAANEIAVDAFLNGRIGFTRIPPWSRMCWAPMRRRRPLPLRIHAVDAQARRRAAALLEIA
jgi:1-deoxy-D-xylulose-5-phosphate reductoisomerase